MKGLEGRGLRFVTACRFCSELYAASRFGGQPCHTTIPIAPLERRELCQASWLCALWVLIIPLRSHSPEQPQVQVIYHNGFLVSIYSMPFLFSEHNRLLGSREAGNSVTGGSGTVRVANDSRRMISFSLTDSSTAGVQADSAGSSFRKAQILP